VLGGREDESNDEAVSGQDLLDNRCSGQLDVSTLEMWNLLVSSLPLCSSTNC
jgi:hypothetical protein